ncbi:MAG: hypothetical protein KAQ91_06670 [Methylococcales bacterium]|nr:hypothetical protein [Methylococcales bacterium]
MEINSQQLNSQQSIPANSAQNQKIANDEINTKEQETLQNSDKTVNLSSEAVKLSSSTNKSSASQITNEEQAEQSAAQFKQDTINSPGLAQKAQSNELSADFVSNLIN